MKKLISIALALALALSVAAVSGISVSAETVTGKSEVWCYIGINGNASKTYTKTDYPDGTDALQAAFNDVKNGVVTLKANQYYVCTNQDITLTKQVTYNGSATMRLSNTYTLKYEPTEADAPLYAMNLNGKTVFLYGSSSADSANPYYVGYNGNAFFTNIKLQLGGTFVGDFIVNDCSSFGVLGATGVSATITGNLAFIGKAFNIVNSEKPLTVNGNIDLSGISTDSAKTSCKTAFETYQTNGYLTLGGTIITEKAAITEPTVTMLEGAAMRIDGVTEGIRFSATVPTADLTAFKDAGATIKDFGMLVADSTTNPTVDSMTVGNSVESTAGNVAESANVVAAKYKGTKPIEDEKSGLTEIVGSLVEIKTANANKQFVARAYIEYTLAGDETVHYVYSNISTARSIAYVAKQIQSGAGEDADYYSSLCAEHKAVVDKWANRYAA